MNRELLGNFPQGFTHLALIRAALNIADAERVERQERSERPAGRRRAVTQARER